ncbi:MAG: trypsin inhibitor-like cysteine-rich domain-containing protein [Sandaracinaceae bacterium]
MLRRARLRARPLASLVVLVALAASPAPDVAAAQDDAMPRQLRVAFTPTERAQVAIWVTSADGARFRTLGLTEAVAYRGIGNRPGALQMNSGFRWPYGRREGVLPVWAHARVAAGAEPFPRVIFNGRISEGNASTVGSAEPRNTEDDYHCLSFDQALSSRDALDAVTCPTRFFSNKGRYLTEVDERRGYAEPFERLDGTPMMRPLDTTSVYPPRRDVTRCAGAGCGDHQDVGSFAEAARRAMPEIDAITMATMAGDRPQELLFDLDEAWPDGPYVLHIEVNVEGDYNAVHNATAYPTPTAPEGMWDTWAVSYGYPYRGQPSVVYEIPFELSDGGGRWVAGTPAGYGDLHGTDGQLRPVDSTITDDPVGHPGEGADRLRLGMDGARVVVVVPASNVCAQPDPPPECSRECTPGGDDCDAGFVCGDGFTCVGRCDVRLEPSGMDGLEVLPYPEPSNAHRFAVLRFRVPTSERGIARYDIRYGTAPIVDAETFAQALPAVEARIDRVELEVPTEGAPGELVEVDLGGLSPETGYVVAVRAVDECNVPGPIATADYRTPAIQFTTVSPCFVATATFGSPLERRVAALRRFRDRHLESHPIGRGLLRAYERVGPWMASVIRERPALRRGAAVALSPVVALAEALAPPGP